MDIEAYLNIEELEKVAKANGIEVPYLRGYRLMSNQEAWTEEMIVKEVEKELDYAFRALTDSAIRMAEAAMMRDIRAYEAETSWLAPYEHQCYTFESDFREQAEVWNRYVGRDDVLYIHSRMGLDALDLKEQPWFLDYVLDAYDPTYCDIYAKIDPATVGRDAEEVEEDAEGNPCRQEGE